MAGAVQRMYTHIDEGYELVNHLFSAGLDRAWRGRAAEVAAASGGARWLDLCTGTGEMAAALARRAPPGVTVTALDFSLPMVRHARAKSANGGVRFLLGDAARLPFADGSFDLVTISFATRNLEAGGPLEGFFREVRRVLAAGGSFVHLETSQPAVAPVRALFRAYVRATVTPLGRLVTGAAGPYRFLTRSVLGFHDLGGLAALLEAAGFAEVTARPLMLGAVAIHEARAGVGAGEPDGA